MGLCQFMVFAHHNYLKKSTICLTKLHYVWLSLTTGRLYKGRMPTGTLSIAHKWTEPSPAPEAIRSLPLHTATELTQEDAGEQQ